MQNKIINYLEELESERAIKILLACETGSRAWGFPSPDSDYDVRLIYIHKRDWYLRLSEGKDSINLMFDDNEIDIAAWDLRKSLRLLAKSNAAMIERIQSPIIYKSDPDFHQEILETAKHFYSKIATMHHYLSMAKSCFSEAKAEPTYKLKKLFYALRTASVCRWVMVQDEMPPIEFHKILNGINISEGLVSKIERLIKLKADVSETYFHTGEEAIFDFISDSISQANEIKNTLLGGKGDMNLLDTLFIKSLKE